MAAGQPTPGKVIEAADFDNLERLGLAEQTTPSDPSSGFVKVFLDSGTGELSVRKSGSTTVSLEGGGGISRTREDIAGVKNGSNTAFTISISGDVDVILNGSILKEGVGYSISGVNITALAPYIPIASDHYEAIIFA